MLIYLSKEMEPQEQQSLLHFLSESDAYVIQRAARILRLASGVEDKEQLAEQVVERFSGVERVEQMEGPYYSVGKVEELGLSSVEVSGERLGPGSGGVVAGPCSVESYEQLAVVAEAIAEKGSKWLRAGAYKPRTSPHEFQGLGREGLEILHRVGQEFGLITVSECMDVTTLEEVAHYVDMIQVGSRNMQNFPLLRALGKMRKPVLLKRGFAATYHELLMAAEYIVAGGNGQVALCERGIRSFETHTRNTLDLCAVPALRSMTHLPIVVDTSHGTGVRDYVLPMTRAAVAAGADAVMVEVHATPDQAWTDAKQVIDLAAYRQLVDEVNAINQLLTSSVAGSSC